MATKVDTGKQLPLKEEGVDQVKKGKSKEEKKRNKVVERWIIFGVLMVTIIVSLGFYVFSSVGKDNRKNDKKDVDKREVEYVGKTENDREGGVFDSVVHEL